MSYETELAFAKDLADEAGKIMRHYFRAEDIGTTWKEDNTPVTIADIKINNLVIKKVKSSFPTHGVLGEEASFEPKRDLIWVVDPIDGTVPFSLGIPVSTFLLALVDRSDGQPVVAVAYDPYLQHLYSATKGGGAFLNGVRLKTSTSNSFFKGYASIYGPPVQTEKVDYWPGKTIDQMRVRGSKTLNFVSGGYTAVKIASGEFVALVMGFGSPWDTAAVCLLVEEAGGLVTDLEGNKRRFDEFGLGCVLAANQTLLTEMLEIVKGS